MYLDKIHGESQVRDILNIFYKNTGLLASMYLVGEVKPICSIEGDPKICEEFCGNPDYYKLIDASDNIRICDKGLKCRVIPIEFEESCIGFFLIQSRDIEGNRENIFKTKDIKEDLDQLLKIKITSIIELVLSKRQIRSENQLLYLSATIRHSISQPIQSLIAMADNLSNEIIDTEAKQMAIFLKNELIKLSYNTGPLSNLDFISHNKNYYFSKVNVISILNEIVDLFRNEAKFKGIEIRNPIVNNFLPIDYVEASEPHIKQIFFNILHNAVRYSYSSLKSKRYISINCSSIKNYLCTEITNYGVGILQNEIDDGLIFQAGYRGTLSLDRNRIGSGLGLAVTKKLIEIHNGEIKIKSKKISDNGKLAAYKTEVIIYLPFIQKR